MLSDCACVIHRDAPSDEWDDGDRRIVSDVLEFGWHMAAVSDPDGRLPWWCYSIGLRHSFAAPDLVMVGLAPESMHRWVSLIVDRLHTGERFVDGDEIDDVFDDSALCMRSVAEGWGEPLFGQGRWFSTDPDPPMMQVVWPDRTGQWPWNTVAPTGPDADQAHLWLTPDEHPRGVWTEWVDDSDR